MEREDEADTIAQQLYEAQDPLIIVEPHDSPFENGAVICLIFSG